MADNNPIHVSMLVVGPVATNCYIVNRAGSNKAVVIDPGSNAPKILEHLEKNNLSPEAILLTHGHFDHFEGVPGILESVRCKTYIFEEEMRLIRDPAMNGSTGLMGRGTAIEPECTVRDGEVLHIADIDFKVIHTPGHTAGGCCYHVEEKEEYLFAGDTIFMESIGRTDLPTGNMSQILSSIREKILTLPDETRIFPGHGPVTDVGYERANNPYA